MRPFAERVREAVAATGPLCVGVDPSAELLARWGLSDDAAGLRAFSSSCVEALTGEVPVLKPQVAFYERHGAEGMRVLEDVVRDARDAGLLVIADAKRGDIGSTMAAYADAWFAGPLAADAVTVAPYVGFGALAPAIDGARRAGGGVLVLVASSNPEGRALQRAVTADGASVEDRLLAEIAAANRDGGDGAVGAVVGATREPTTVPLSAIGGVVLAPGIGAQGATARDVARLFGECPPGSVLPSASRSVLGAGPGSVRDAAVRLRDELAAALL